MTEQTKVPEFTFVLDLNEANAILAALQELPAKIANTITEKLRAQAQEQLPQQEVAEDAVSDE